MNAFDFKFGGKISLRGPETVRKTHSSTSSSSTSSTSSTSSSSSRRRSSSRSSCSRSSSSSSSSSRRGKSRSRSRNRSSSSRAREEREREGKRERERERGREGGNRWLRLAGFWRVSDWFLTLQRDSCQLDLKAKAEIPRCTSGSGGAVAAGVVVVLRVVANLVMRVRIHAWTHSISNLGAK